MLYHLVARFLTLVTRVFFRQIEVSGADQVPKDKPVIFVGNHPNSLIDPVLVTTCCGRKVHFAAKDVLFESAFLRFFLRALGAVPISRRMDHGEGKVDNAEAFDALLAVLKRGGAFGIFPEGISHISSELAPLKTGAARIALQAIDQGIDVQIVPCGLSYFRRHRMRSRVLVQLADPIEIAPEIIELARSDPKGAARALTEQIDDELRAQTINASDFETLQVLQAARRLYTPPDQRLSLAEKAEVARRIIDHYEANKEQPDVRQLFADIDEYLFELRALGLRDAQIRRPLSKLAQTNELFRHLSLCLLLLPAALPGVLVHAPVLLMAIYAGENLAVRKDVTATTKMMFATFGTVLGYAAFTFVVFMQLPFPNDVKTAVVLLTGLLASGWATIRVLEGQSRVRRAFFILGRLLDLRNEMERLRTRRDSLRMRMLAAVEKYYQDTGDRIIPPQPLPEGPHR